MASRDSEFLKNFWIPSYVLVPEPATESSQIAGGDGPKCPVLVFANSKSGGQLGGDLLKTYRALLNEKQVFDLGEEAPEKVLSRVYANLERLKTQGDQLAIGIMESLRLIV
ncbi:hypothetical protein PIB30_074076, partial [Stylosanthes scabra]|nr:hypothetical protein [Stylosanthes scabra]